MPRIAVRTVQRELWYDIKIEEIHIKHGDYRENCYKCTDWCEFQEWRIHYITWLDPKKQAQQ